MSNSHPRLCQTIGHHPKVKPINNSTGDRLVLDSFLRNDQGLMARLVILQDCLSQSGLPILVHLIDRLTNCKNNNQSEHRYNSSDSVLLINTNSDLSRMLQRRTNECSPSSSSFNLIDLNELMDQESNDPVDPSKIFQSIIGRVFRFIDQSTNDSKSQSPSLSIIIDSIQEFYRLFSIHQSFKFLKSLVDLLPNPRSRLIVLNSPHLKLSRPQSVFDSSVTSELSSLSNSLLHLRIHPTSLLNQLINQFGIPVPIQSSQPIGTYYDLRLFPLIDELAHQTVPYSITTTAKAEENDHQLVPQALLIPFDPSIPNLGSCVIEWTAKNISSCQSRPSTSIRPKSSDPKSRATRSVNMTSVQHGLEGLQLLVESPSITGFSLNPLPISKIIYKKTLKLSSGVNRSNFKNPADSPDSNAQLTFNLSLTEKQKADREAVQLPFLPKRSKDGSVIEAPGHIYDGSFQDQDSTNHRNCSGMILYEPDSADDLDDEEPDDDF